MRIGPPPRLDLGRPPERSRPGSPAVLLAALLAIAGAAGCTTSQSPPASPTPYPIRSPISSPPARPFPAPADETARLAAEARSRATAGDPADAFRLLDGALAASPSDPALLAARADLRLAEGDPASAVADLSTAVATTSRRADLLQARAGAFAALGDLDRAERDWSRAIALDPGDPAAHIGRALVLTDRALGSTADYQRALDDLGRAAAVDPTSVETRLARARLYLDRLRFGGDPADGERALAELRTLAAGRGGERAALLRAEALAATGDAEAASTALDAPAIATTADRPPLPGVHALAEARIAAAARRWDDAVVAATAASRAPTTAIAGGRLLAEAQLGAGDPSAALATTDALLERLPVDGVAWFLRGLALNQLAQPDDAVTALVRARELLPDSPVYRARIDQQLGPAPTPASPPPSGG